MYYITRVNLSNEVNILPAPQTLKDVLEFRKSPYIKSFRNRLIEWSHYKEKGEYKLAEKMKSDFIKANQSLKRIGKYKEFSKSPYFRISILLGGILNIYAGIALGTASFIEPYLIDYFSEKNNFILLTKDK